MIRRVLTIAITLLVFAAGASVAGPGDGAAVISPPGNIQASSSGTWTITYTTNDQFNSGTVRVTIPSGWTAPQKSSSTSPGYTTVSSTAPTGLPPSMSIVGNVITISVDTLDTGLSLSLVYGDDSGSAAGRATAASALGTYEFTVADHPTSTPAVNIANSPTIDINVGAPFQLAILPADTSVTAGEFGQFRVVVEDNTGTPVPALSDRTVQLFPGSGSFYLPSNHSTPITQVIIPAGTQSARVDYRSTLAGDPSLIAIATDGKSPTLNSGITGVTVTPAAVSASQSTISATSPVVADGVAQSIVTVTSKDQYGNPRANDTVLIGADGDATPTQPGSNTNASGVASGVVTNTTAELVTVSATIGATSINATAQVNFIAGAADADSSTISASTPVVANGVATSTVTVTVRDGEGNPVPGASVTLSVSPSGDGEVLSQPGGVTGSNGVATGSLSSTKTGPRVIHAIADAASLADSAVVDFVAGSVANFEWITDGASVAGVYEPVTLTARDSQGNVVTGFTGLVNLSTTSGGVGDVVDWGAQDAVNSPTNGSGDQATYQFALGDSGSVVLLVRNTLMETYRVNASAGASGQSPDIVNDHAAASQIAILAGDGQMRTVGQSVTTPPLVFVSDAFDNPVGGQTVTFAPQTAGSSVDVVAGGGVQTTGTTNASGQLDCDVWTLATLAGPNTLRVSILAGSPFVDFTATGDPDVGASIVISPASKNVTVNTGETVTLTLRDQYTNLVEGERVDVFISDTPEGSISPNGSDPNPTTTINSSARWGNTDANGQISVVYDAPGTASLSDVIDASTSLVSAASVTDAVYTTIASGATNLRITFVGPSTVTANTTFEFLVEAVDGGGNVFTGNSSTVTLTPEAGSGLQFSESDFGTPVTQVTLSSGAATVYGKGTKARAIGWDVTADAAGLASDTKKVTITDTGVVDHYFVSTVDSVVAGVSFSVAIQARDEFDNLVDTATNTVNLAAVLASDPNTLASSTLSVVQTTLVSGQANVGESYTKAETIQVRARDASTNEGFSGDVKVKPAAAERVFKVSGDASNVVAGSTQPLVVVVRDQYSNPVPSVTVTFTPTAGGGFMTGSPALTGVNGQAGATLHTGGTVASNTVAATILGGAPPDQRVDFLVQTIPSPVIDHFVVTPAKTSAVAGEVFGVGVVAKDANDNTVTTDNSTVVTMSSDGDMAFTAPSGSLTGGVFATSMYDTTAETVVVTATGAGKTGDSAPITIGNAPLHKIVYISGDASGVPVTSQQTLEVEARDQYGNAVAGAGVTFQVVNSPGPTSFIDAVGDPNDGITTTNGAGRGTVDLVTAATAGTHDVKATILAGTPPDQRVDFSVSTVAGGITHYEVLLSTTSQTAGQPVGVTVRALDGSNNLVSTDNTTSVTLSLDPGTGAVWGGPNPATLSGGQIVTSVTLTQVQTFQVRAITTGNPSITGLSASANITPAAPAGTITATASKPTITATGLTTSDFTSSIIRDQYLNQVTAGALVTVDTTQGLATFDSDDQDLVTPGLQRAVNASGRITFRARSKTTPGTETFTMQSVVGTASGSVQLTLAPPPSFATPGEPNPSVVYVGQTLSFKVPVNNTSTTDAILNVATNFTFTDGAHTYTAVITGLPHTIPGGAVNDSLTFANTQVSPDQDPTFYAPTVNLFGLDEFGAPFSKSSTFPAQSLLVSAVQIESITAPALVSRGKVDTVSVRINNPTASTVTINSVLPRFSGTVGAAFTPESGLGLPLALTQFTSADVKVPVLIGASTPTGLYTINATVSGTVGGTPVSDTDVAPNPTASWTVQSGAALSYVPASLAPTMVTRGQSYALSVQVQNTGGATVTLDAGTTFIDFTDGGQTYTATLTQAAAIAGNMTQTITFASQAVPLMTPGSYTPTLHLNGTENGVPFSATIDTNPDQVAVETPAVISESTPNSLSPDLVSRGQFVQFTAALSNAGGSSVILNPATTTITFGGIFSAPLSAAGETTLDPGTRTITFVSTEVGAGINLGAYTPVIHLAGTENGHPFSGDVPLADSVVVEQPPQFAIVAVTPSQSTYTQNQVAPITVKVRVANNGAAVDFQNASLSFTLGGGEKTNQFNISTPTAFQVHGTRLQGGEADTLVFTVGDSPIPMDTGLMTIAASITVKDVNSGTLITTPASSSKGSLLVQSPGSIQVVNFLPAQSTVTQSMGKSFDIDLVVHNGGGSDLTLNLIDPSSRLTFSPSPGWVAPVVGALAGGGNVLSGGETDTITFTVTGSGSTLGPATVGTVLAAVENNSGVSRGVTVPSVGSITVEAAAQLVVDNVSLSRTTLTNGANVSWQITADVSNPGEADLQLILPTGIGVTFQDATAPPAYTKPVALDGDGTVLAGGGNGTLTIPVAATGTFSSLGSKLVTVNVVGTDVNSDVSIPAGNSSSVTIQATPVPDYIETSLSPAVVSLGSTVEFNVQVQNTVAGGATIELDEASTNLTFAGGNFGAQLKPGANAIAGGATETLQFTGQPIPLSAPIGPQGDVALNLVWTQNGVPGSTSLVVQAADLVVQAAPNLSIQSIYPSRTAVTAGLQPPWRIVMVVVNSGEADVEINPLSANTYLALRTLGGVDKTVEYTIFPPTELEGENSLILPGGSTVDSLFFDVATTGNTTGTIVISGGVEGRNVLNSDILNDAVQGGSFAVQTPADLQMVKVVSSRATATVGQTTPYNIRMAVKNNGGAAARVNLDSSTFLEFSASSGWSVAQQPQLAGGGNTLSGGETDSVVFTVNTTGNPVGLKTIGGRVTGYESNRPSVALSDTTTAPESGSITLQVPAAIVVDNVVVSRSTVTQNTSVGWNVKLTLSNVNGGSTAQLLLPGSVNVAVQDGSVVAGVVNGFDEGGTTLVGGDSRTLTVPITGTGSFSSLGLKNVTVDVDYVDINSGDVTNVQGQETITIQDPPNLQYVVQTLDPDTASTNAVVQFRIQVTNVGTGSASAVLNRASTRLYFDTGPTSYSAFLDITSDDTIDGGETATLLFEKKQLTSAMGDYPVTAFLAHSANGVSDSDAFAINNELHVDQAPQLHLVSMTPSQAVVTAGMSKVWTVSMEVENNGPAAVELDLSTQQTYISFNKPGFGDILTYVVVNPTQVVQTGSDTLQSGQQGTLVFQVQMVGSVTGNITINGHVAGQDLGSVEMVEDDTFDGGSGSVLVQSAPVLDIVRITPSRTTVTENQTTDWTARVVVKNNGEASAQIQLDSSDLGFPAGSGAWVTLDPTLGGGGSVIAGGATDSLLFVVDQTGTAGVRRIDAGVRGVDVNSNEAVFDTTDTSGFGSITVQMPPAIRMTTTSISAPNAPFVNTGQAFGVAVQVTNDGQATANNVAFTLTHTGNSTLGTPPVPVASVPAGSTRVYTFPVSAAGNPPSDTFTARFSGGVDANSGQVMTPGQFARDDSTATAQIGAAAALAVTRVTPSQATVTRGQSTPWSIVVVVSNTGDAALNLTPPVAGNIAFSIGGSPSTGYTVVPPTTFYNGNAGWNLAGGATDSMTYTVTQTSGNDVGTVDIDATLGFADVNDPAHTGNATKRGNVVVQNPAGLSIVATEPVPGTTFNNPSGSLSRVNTNWPYQIRVTVLNQNSGEAVDSVHVVLTSDGTSAISLASQDKISIAENGQGIFDFNVTAPGSPNPLETFTSSILYAQSHNTGLQVDPAQPTDNAHTTTTQAPADLKTTLGITAPQGAKDGSVSKDQQFTVGATVRNFGEASLTGTSELTLALPAGFSLASGSLTKAFGVAPTDTTFWTVLAPSSPQGAENLTVSISTFPKDANNNQDAASSQPNASVAVSVEAGGAFSNTSLVFSSPAGALDGVISTDQFFRVLATVRPSADAVGVAATLLPPAGFTVVGASVKALGDGDGTTDKTATFDMIAPAGAVLDTIKVRFTATDRNTNQPVTPETLPLVVDVIPRTSLTLSASVIAPAEAVDRTVTVGTPFTIRANVANAIGAAGITGTAQVRLTPPSGYALQSPAVQTFTIAGNVDWVVEAAQIPSGPDDIVIDIVVPGPNDENTGQAATVASGQVTISMVTEGAAVSVLDVTSSLGIDTRVAPAGTADLRILGFDLRYDNSDAQAAAARIDTIAVTVVNKNGTPLSDSAVQRTLSRVFIQLDAAAPYETSVISTNPVVVAFSGAGAERFIAPDSSRTVVVGLDLGKNPAEDEIRLQIRGNGIRVKDNVSNQPLGVVERSSQQPLDGRLTSQPLVILGSSFEEYAHNYPNPFRAGSQATHIAYFMNAPGDVSVKIYALTGDLVFEESIPRGDARAGAGPQEFDWDGRNMKGEVVRNGIYICVLNAGSNSAKIRIAVAK